MIVLVLVLGVSYCPVLLFILYSSFYSLCSPLQLSSLSYILYGLISPFLLLRCALFSSLFHRLLSFLLTACILIHFLFLVSFHFFFVVSFSFSSYLRFLLPPSLPSYPPTYLPSFYFSLSFCPRFA